MSSNSFSSKNKTKQKNSNSSASPSTKSLIHPSASPIVLPIELTNIKPLNLEVIELIGNDDDSCVTNSSNLSGTSAKPWDKVSKDSVEKYPTSEMMIIPPKPADGIMDSDAVMDGGEHGTSTNLLDYDCDMLNSPKSVVVSKDSGDPSSKAGSDPTKRAVGFQSTVDDVMVRELNNNDNDEKMTDFQQLAKANTSTNTRKSSLQLGVINKSIIPI